MLYSSHVGERMTEQQHLLRFGYRFGRNGAHAARTMMLGEVSILLARVADVASPDLYKQEVVDSVCRA